MLAHNAAGNIAGPDIRSREDEGVPGGAHAFAHIESWIFDLDDTLYEQETGLFQQMRNRIVLFLADLMKTDFATASKVHGYYYKRYGATLQALVQRHKLNPGAFLDFVHDVDLSVLSRNERLAEALARLPGRRIVFTNGSAHHAEKVLAALGIDHLFEPVCHIENRGFVGKPQRRAYDLLLEQYALDPRTAAIFDDREDNLVIPHERGMRTVLVAPIGQDVPCRGKLPHVDVITTDLTGFLAKLPFAKGQSLSKHNRANNGI